MTLVAVGGHARNVGKTSVVEGLIRAFPARPWTAVKLSSHRHATSGPGEAGPAPGRCEIHEATRRDGSSDTARDLAAGAARSLWMRIEGDSPGTAESCLMPVLRSSRFAIVESNRLVRWVRPDLAILVLRYDAGEFKESARFFLEHADAVVAVNPDGLRPPWPGVSRIISGIPQFVAQDPRILPEGLVDFAARRIPAE